jgi:hypothetical protein
MQIPFLHQQLILETERLRDMHRSMMMHESAIPSGETEALLQQLRKIYGIALQLGNENALQLLNEIHLANSQQFAAKEIENESVKSVEKIREPEMQEKTIDKTADMPVAVQQPVESPVAKQVNAQPVNAAPNVQSARTVAKKFAEPSTLAEKIAGNESQRRLSDNIKIPVKDINAAIGINEKFQFINQLFHGDSNRYNQFITELNNCPTADEAHNSIQKMSDANQWNDAPIARHFIEVVERRFSV